RLPSDPRGLSRSHQAVCSVARLLASLHQASRRLPHRLRPKSYFGGQHGATEEMRTDARCEVPLTPWTHIRPASEHIGSEFGYPKAEVAAQAVGNGVTDAIEKGQASFFRSQ